MSHKNSKSAILAHEIFTIYSIYFKLLQFIACIINYLQSCKTKLYVHHVTGGRQRGNIAKMSIFRIFWKLTLGRPHHLQLQYFMPENFFERFYGAGGVREPIFKKFEKLKFSPYCLSDASGCQGSPMIEFYSFERSLRYRLKTVWVWILCCI